MKAITVFLLVLCHLAVSHGNGRGMSMGPGRLSPTPSKPILPVPQGWTCKEAPRLLNAQQIDAGQGEVVASNGDFAFILIGEVWHRMSAIRIKHVSVGPAGLWGCGDTNWVYKYVAGDFQQSTGKSLQQVDAGGDDQVVGVTPSSYDTYCLTSSAALAYSGVGSLGWEPFRRQMRYYSCGQKYGCWGVDRNYNVYVTKGISSANCGTSAWTRVTGLTITMVEVGTDGRVFGVTRNGLVFERVGITNERREGKSWAPVSLYLPVRHLSYDLGKLWVVTNYGLIMQCMQ